MSDKVLPVAEMLSQSLVDAGGNPVAGSELAKKQYLLLYFSAHWCPPCRAFTPQLVNFYNQNKKSDNFEVILISADKSPDAMLQYMTEMSMPWPALSYESPLKAKLSDELGVNGIPCLVMFNNNGQVVSSSYQGTTYVGPNTVLDDLKEILKTIAFEPDQKKEAPPVTPVEQNNKQTPAESNPASSATNNSEDISQTYEFNGVLKSKAGNVAIINNKLVSPGDSIDGTAQVKEITDKHVIIAIGDKVYTLNPSSGK